MSSAGQGTVKEGSGTSSTFSSVPDGTYQIAVQVKNSYVWSSAAASSVSVGDVTVPTPIIDYSFDDAAAGTTRLHNSGSGGSTFDAIVQNAGALGAGSHNGSTTIKFPGGPRGTNGSTMPYLQIPNGVYKDKTALTVATWMYWDGANANAAGSPWAYILGGDQLPQNNYGLYMTPSENGQLTADAFDGSEYKTNSAAALKANTWNHVALTIDGTSLVVFVNGVETDRRPAPISFTKLYNDASTYSGLVGRTQWSDPYASFFGGQLDDFEVFDSALTGAQVAKLVGSSTAQVTGFTPAQPQSVDTAIGQQPTLPTYYGTYSDGVNRAVAVAWDAIDPSKLNAPGSFSLLGRIPAFGNATVTVTVNVKTPAPMKIDLGADTGPFTGGAGGTLYGVYGEDLPSKNLVEGVNLTSIATKTQDGRQHPGADAYESLKNMVDSTGGGTVYIYATDTYYGAGYPITTFDPQLNQATATQVGGAWSDQLANYKLELKRQIEAANKLDAKYRDRIVWIPFNEPELNWVGWNNPTFYATWDEVYRYIRSLDPQAKIAGPNNTHLRDVQDFFAHTITANTVPDVYTWHELSSPGTIRNNVADYRAAEAQAFAGTRLQGTQLPVNINEYAYRYHTSVPGQMIQWMAAIEDSKVEGDVAYWNVDGNLNDETVETNRGNGSWWLYYAYGQMTGRTVKVTPPSTDSYTLQGISTLDKDKKQSRTIVGGATGYQTLSFSNIDRTVFGSTINVQIQEIPWTGQLGDSEQPDTIADYTTAVKNDGSLDVVFNGLAAGTLPSMKEGAAYQVILSPGANAATSATSSRYTWSSSFEAESGALSGGAAVQGPNGGPDNVAAFYTSGGYDVTGFSTGSNAKDELTVNVPADGPYDARLIGQTTFTDGAAQQQGPTNVFMTVDGQPASQQQLYLPVTYKDFVWGQTSTRLQLTKGTHKIQISTAGNQANTVGNGRIDRLDLSLPNPQAVNVYEAEFAKLSDATSVDYSQRALSGPGVVALSGTNSASFFVYSADAGQSDVTFDTLGGGTAALTVNGQQINGAIGSSTTMPLTLQAGVNKITVTGQTGRLLLDRLTVAAHLDGALKATRYQAEDSSVAQIGAGAPDTKVASYSLADGGKAVTGIGGTYAGDISTGKDKNTLTFSVNSSSGGVQALTIRYSNDTASQASHYNPDTLALHAQLSVNGAAPSTVWFANTLNKNQFATLTTYVTLQAGKNTLTFSSRELPNFGQTDQYVSQVYPPVGAELFRSAWAPQIDWIELASLGGSTETAAVKAQLTSNTPANAADWYRSPVSVALSTPASGVSVQYRTDPAASWTTVTGPVVVDKDGITTVAYRATRGGVEVPGSQGSVEVKLDRLAPITTATTDPASGTAATGSKVTVRFAATDMTAGVAYTEYSTDNGATWTRDSGNGLAITTTGATVVQYRSADDAGNVETTKQVTATITDPNITAAVAITSAGPPTADGWYNQTVLVKMTAPRAGQQVQYQVGAGSWRTYTGPISVTGNGVTVLNYRLLASNVVISGSQAQTQIKIDKGLPIATATRNPATGTGTPRNPVTVQFGGTDQLSGLADVQYRVNGGDWVTAGSDPLTLDQVGDYLLTYRATDKAGNISINRSLTVSINADTATTIKASAKTVQASGYITFAVAGFRRFDTVSISMNGKTLNQVVTDQNGTARTTVKIPADATAGSTTITAVGTDTAISAAVTITVQQ